MEIQVIERQRVADKCFAWYVSATGEVVRAEITAKQYADLALPGSGEPQPRPELPKGDWIWLYSAGRCVRLDTLDGEVGEGDWYSGDAKCPAIIGLSQGKAALLEPHEYTKVGDRVTLTLGAVADLQAQGAL